MWEIFVFLFFLGLILDVIVFSIPSFLLWGSSLLIGGLSYAFLKSDFIKSINTDSYSNLVTILLTKDDDISYTIDNSEEVENSETKAKIVIHQCARLLWLAEKVEAVAARRPAFQIMFYLIAAEAISKIVFDYKGNNSSKKYVRQIK